jgi:hypothetical protein
MGRIIKNDRVTDILSPSGIDYEKLILDGSTSVNVDLPVTTLNMVYGMYLSSIGAHANSTTTSDDQIKYALSKGYTTFNGGIYTVTDKTIIHSLKDTKGSAFFYLDGNKYPVGDVTENLVMKVPDVFYNIQHCFEWLSSKRILNNAHVDIKVADGVYEQSWVNNLNHIDGSNISIRGNEDTPSLCVINLDNLDNRDCFRVSDGHTIAWLNGFTIRGTKGWLEDYKWGDQCYGAGIRAVDSGSIKCGTAIVIDKMYYGLRAMHGATISAIANVPVGSYGGGVLISNAGDVGIHAHNATVYCNGAEVTKTGDNAHGLGFGFCAEAGGYIVCEYATAINNLKAGFYALSNGTAWAHGVYAQANAYGVLAWSGTVECNTLLPFKTQLINNTTAGICSIFKGFVGGNSAIVTGNLDGVLAQDNGVVDATAILSSNNTNNGFYAKDSGYITGYATVANNNGTNGYYAERDGTIKCPNGQANNNKNIGFFSNISSKILCNGFGGVGNSVFCSPTQSSVSKDSGNTGSYIIDQ